jgi:hypothetical protein
VKSTEGDENQRLVDRWKIVIFRERSSFEAAFREGFFGRESMVKGTLG